MFVVSCGDHESLGTDKVSNCLGAGSQASLLASPYTTGSILPVRIHLVHSPGFVEKGIWLCICLIFGFADKVAMGVEWVQFHCLSFLLA